MKACGKCRQRFHEFPNGLKVGNNALFPNHFRSGAVNDGVATLLWMVCSPVTMRSTIHPLSGEDSLVLKMIKHPSNKSTNASGTNLTFLPGECQNELSIPAIADTYNQHRVCVDVANQYLTYYDIQLRFRCNWYPLFNWILQTAFINSIIIYQDFPANQECTVELFGIHLSFVHDILQAGSASTMKSSSCIPASQKITQLAPTTQSALPPLPTRPVSKHTTLPHNRKVPGMHSPLWFECGVDCIICRRRNQGGDEIDMKTTIKCEDCNEAFCFTPKCNCFYGFHCM